MMTHRPYKPVYRQKCLEIFDSNCPRYFHESEREMFEKWLDRQGEPSSAYSSPTYNNALKDAYFVIDDPKHGIVACGGFYVLKDKKEARLAWGMVQGGFHNTGLGTELFRFRINAIKKEWPGYEITLCTSQYTFKFYENMGLEVINITKDGFGKGLDRYDMIYTNSR